MKWILGLVWCFTWLNLEGQMPFSRLYTQADGLKTSEALGSAFTFDSLCYIWEGNRTLSVFDGYRFTTINNPGFELYVKYTSSDIHSSNASLLQINSDNFLYKNKTFRLVAKPKNSIIFVYNNEFRSISHDSIFVLDQDKVRWNFVNKIDLAILNLIQYSEDNLITTYISRDDTLLISTKSEVYILDICEKPKILELPKAPLDQNIPYTDRIRKWLDFYILLINLQKTISLRLSPLKMKMKNT